MNTKPVEMNEKTAEFLRELTALTMKYKLEIAGCGCCGSPRIDPQSSPGHYEATPLSDGGAAHLEWKIVREF